MTAEASKLNAYAITGVPNDKIGASKINAYLITGGVFNGIGNSKLNAYLVFDGTPPPSIGTGNMFMVF